MILARVLCGRSTVGTMGVAAPPEVPGQGGRHYDSFTDKEESPSLFVSCHDNQACPEILIEFQRQHSMGVYWTTATVPGGTPQVVYESGTPVTVFVPLHIGVGAPFSYFA